MKDIDYEAIVKEAAKRRGWPPVSTEYVKAIIEAYEAQKTQPEWVPLDLEKVVKGQEVRRSLDRAESRFVSRYLKGFVVDGPADYGYFAYASDWLMRAPKPKTIAFRVYRRVADSTRYMALMPDIGLSRQTWTPVGEDEIEVRE